MGRGEMKAVEFCYWLQGLFEVGEPEKLDEKQTDLIKRHLNMVFIHDIDKTYPEGQQTALDDAHAGKTTPSTMNNRPPGMRC